MKFAVSDTTRDYLHKFWSMLDEILTVTYAVVLFSIIIQGLTMQSLRRYAFSLESQGIVKILFKCILQ
jgi:NhaP-type Na+/H+ or K+/H+ antiporter